MVPILWIYFLASWTTHLTFNTRSSWNSFQCDIHFTLWMVSRHELYISTNFSLRISVTLFVTRFLQDILRTSVSATDWYVLFCVQFKFSYYTLELYNFMFWRPVVNRCTCENEIYLMFCSSQSFTDLDCQDI